MRRNGRSKTLSIHSKGFRCFKSKPCERPGLLQESLGPFGPEVSPECPRECPRKPGVSEGVSDGVSPGPFGPHALRSVQKRVPRVSPECQKGVLDTPGTLSGHFLDTPERGARRAPETPRRTLPQTPPVFGDTPGTLRARRARETPVAGRGVRKANLKGAEKKADSPKTLFWTPVSLHDAFREF